MIREFDEHEVRLCKELSGCFLFRTSDDREYSIPVPGCWEQNIDLINYRGKGSYYKDLYVSKDCNVRLYFKGVSHTADVYFDDTFITHHYNAYTGFEAVICNVSKGHHHLRVDVDNSFSEVSALHKPNDYETFGGIIRPLVFEELSDVYVKSMHFEPRFEDGIWSGTTSLTIKNLSASDKKVCVSLSLASTSFSKADKSLDITINANSQEKVSFDIEYPDILPWSSQNPNLYYLKAEVTNDSGNLIDDLIDRVGFRTISINGNDILLNNEKLFLKGFNRHEDFGTLGNAVPYQIMVSDLDMVKDLGGNAIRTCHYPNDERFLDLCDERGILVWEENHARGLSLGDMCNPNFDRQCKDCIDEMIDQHFNHPSIFIWGILNECASDTEVGRNKYKLQYDQIKKLDTSRPRTSATCKHFSDICLDIPEVVSINIYTGWYEDADDKERFEREKEWLDTTQGAGKPLIISEFGAAAVYGFRDMGHSKWSEERQADIICSNLDVYYNDPRVSGVFLWQFADCKVTEKDWFYTRARTHNNKGIVDEYRRPKLSYQTVKEYFHKERNL